MSDDDLGWRIPTLRAHGRQDLAKHVSQSSTAAEHDLRERWSRLVHGRANLGAVAADAFGGGELASPERIRIVAAAYAEYLSASRQVAAALGSTEPHSPEWTTWLGDWVGYLEELRAIIHPSAHATVDADPNEPGRIVAESGVLVAQTRNLLRRLGRGESSAAGRAHAAVVAAWGQYDEGISELVDAAAEQSGGSLSTLAAKVDELRDALLIELGAARELCAGLDGRLPPGPIRPRPFGQP